MVSCLLSVRPFWSQFYLFFISVLKNARVPLRASASVLVRYFLFSVLKSARVPLRATRVLIGHSFSKFLRT